MLHILQQPSESTVANRYLIPAPELVVSSHVMTGESTFVVCVTLSYHGEGEEVIDKSIDGKQDVLQGIKRVTVDTDNRVAFTKLKVMDVSSKHRHQPFCLVFTLEEYHVDGRKEIHSTMRTSPFQVQSRPNKRKALPGEQPAPKRFANSLDITRTSSMPNVPTLR
jgi:hypothetical protein